MAKFLSAVIGFAIGVFGTDLVFGWRLDGGIFFGLVVGYGVALIGQRKRADDHLPAASIGLSRESQYGPELAVFTAVKQCGTWHISDDELYCAQCRGFHRGPVVE